MNHAAEKENGGTVERPAQPVGTEHLIQTAGSQGPSQTAIATTQDTMPSSILLTLPPEVRNEIYFACLSASECKDLDPQDEDDERDIDQEQELNFALSNIGRRYVPFQVRKVAFPSTVGFFLAIAFKAMPNPIPALWQVNKQLRVESIGAHLGSNMVLILDDDGGSKTIEALEDWMHVMDPEALKLIRQVRVQVSFILPNFANTCPFNSEVLARCLLKKNGLVEARYPHKVPMFRFDLDDKEGVIRIRTVCALYPSQKTWLSYFMSDYFQRSVKPGKTLDGIDLLNAILQFKEWEFYMLDKSYDRDIRSILRFEGDVKWIFDVAAEDAADLGVGEATVEDYSRVPDCSLGCGDWMGCNGRGCNGGGGYIDYPIGRATKFRHVVCELRPPVEEWKVDPEEERQIRFW